MAVCFEYNTKSLMSMPAAENITVSRDRGFLFRDGGLVSWRFAEWIVAGMLNMLSLDLRVQTALSFFPAIRLYLFDHLSSILGSILGSATDSQFIQDPLLRWWEEHAQICVALQRNASPSDGMEQSR